MNTFDATTHTYKIEGVAVPSVTQVLSDLIPGWQASEWYLQRGTAVHACCAMIARGVAFDHDPAIDGQVSACRRFFEEVKPYALYCTTECRLFSNRYNFGGTLDLVAVIGNDRTIIDWKASFGAALPYQLAAYSIMYHEVFHGCVINRGVGVQLNEDGTYKMSQVYDLRNYKNGFLALLSAYKIRRACKVKEEGTKE
jgi:hypothetical protein